MRRPARVSGTFCPRFPYFTGDDSRRTITFRTREREGNKENRTKECLKLKTFEEYSTYFQTIYGLFKISTHAVENRFLRPDRSEVESVETLFVRIISSYVP